MKNTIVVRKNKAHRTLVISLTIILALLILIQLNVLIKKGMLLYILPYLIPLFLFVAISVYYESWKIVFSKESITKSVFFKKSECYNYYNITRAESGFSYTENQYIMVLFSNGKSIRFRKEDENASKAVSILCKHCSIKYV